MCMFIEAFTMHDTKNLARALKFERFLVFVIWLVVIFVFCCWSMHFDFIVVGRLCLLEAKSLNRNTPKTELSKVHKVTIVWNMYRKTARL